MIIKASELLELFIEEESKKLADIEMPHMPTLGTAYEEITRQGIDKEFAIPKHLDLNVVSGFISVGGEMLPEQIDCMLVHGLGKRYGLTDQYIVDIERVLCIFEVKKTLRKGDFVDAIDHLAGIRKKFAEYFENKLVNEGYEPDLSNARKLFSLITGKDAPEKYSGMHHIPIEEGVLFYCLVQESLAPVSVIHAYDGYKTEHGLRTALVDLIESRAGTEKSLGIPLIPSLVTSNKFCLVKGTGGASVALNDGGEWVSIYSTRHNPVKMILELVWAKISSYFRVEMPWGDGLHLDNVAPLFTARAVEKEGSAGWLYKPLELTEKQLRRLDDSQWSPDLVGPAEASAIRLMAAYGGYLSLDRDMEQYLQDKYGAALSSVVENLVSTRLFMKSDGYLRPINARTYLVMLDERAGYVCSERERMDIWCDQNGVEKRYLTILLVGFNK